MQKRSYACSFMPYDSRWAINSEISRGSRDRLYM